MKRIGGITYLKAFLPLFVIACHIRPFGKSSLMSLPLPSAPGITDVFYLNVCYLAVPLFFIISLFLYLKKRNRTKNRFKLCLSRVSYFLAIFLAVRVIYIFFDIGKLWVPDRGVFKNLYAFIFGGGDTLLYYLEICAYFFVFTEICCFAVERFKISKKLFSIIGLIFSVALLAGIYLLPYEALKCELLRFYSPFCFLPYPFIALYFSEAEESIGNFVLYILLLLGIGFTVFELFCLPDPAYIEYGYAIAIPSYARVSVILISMSLFGLALKLKKIPSKCTEYLASLSLYVYCIHQIIITLISDYIHSSALCYAAVVLTSYSLSVIILFIKKTLNSHFEIKS